MVAINLGPGDQSYLDQALDRVNNVLREKGKTWANNADAFENFDLMKELGVSPYLFGIMMCRLKMNRLKSSLRRTGGQLIGDTDAKDCLLDLACYAILTLGILEREEDRLRTQRIKKGIEESRGKSRQELAAELRGELATQAWVDELTQPPGFEVEQVLDMLRGGTKQPIDLTSMKKKDIRKVMPDEARSTVEHHGDVGGDGPVTLPYQHQSDSGSSSPPSRPVPQRGSPLAHHVGQRLPTERDIWRDTGNPDNTDLGTLI